MSHDAFLQAILDRPDDDAPRLVYADWLEEQGDPRAEFIRVQCELASAEREGLRKPWLERREEQLLARYAEAWSQSLLQQLPVFRDRVAVHLELKRGFVGGIDVDGDYFLAHASRLLSILPLLQSARMHCQERDLTLLADCPHLRRLRSLTIRTFEHLRDESAFIALVASQHTIDLEFLGANLSACRRFRTPHTLATMLASRRLKGLVMDGNKSIGRQIIRVLAESGCSATLQQLFLIANLKDAQVVDLCSSQYFPKLVHLDLFINAFGIRGMRALCHSSQFPRLRRVSLLHNPLNVKAIATLADSPLLSQLTTLALGRVTKQKLRGWAFGDKGAKILASSPHVSGLTYIALCHSEIEDVGAFALAESPHWNRNVWISLKGNPISAKGQAALRERFGERVDLDP